MDLSVAVGGLTLKNPVLTASGTFGYGLEYDDHFDVAELGGICTKGLSLAPRPGNPPARIWETSAGMLNAIGLANVGVEAFCRDKLPILRERGVTVIPNIFATSIDDFVALATRLDGEAGIAALDLVEAADDLRAALFDNARYWRAGLADAGFTLLPGEHPIIPVMLGEAKLAQALAAELYDRGVYVSGFFFPVVPKGQARIRTQMNAKLTRDDLDLALDAFRGAGRAVGAI